MLQTDRRTAPRLPIQRPVKLRSDRGGWRCLTGQTHDLSQSGALIEVDSLTALLPGQSLQLAIANDAHCAIIPAERLVPATVVRSIWNRGQQRVAVRFTESSNASLPLAG